MGRCENKEAWPENQDALNRPANEGFYWVKGMAGDEWTIVRVYLLLGFWRVEALGDDEEYFIERFEEEYGIEWGDEIKRG